MGNFLELLRDRLVYRSQLGKRQLDAAFVRRELDEKLQELGEAFSTLVRDGKATVPEELAKLMSVVKELESELEKKEAEIADLKREDAIERQE